MQKFKSAPSFLIIGAQKCGTTALHNYLSRHPQIAGSNPKELHFFNSDYNYNKGIEYYNSLFYNCNDGLVKFEASPSYLVSPVAASRIFKYNSKIKLIVLLRNPIDRAFSAWNMYKKRYESNRNWFYDDWLCHIEPHKDYVKRSDSSLFDFYSYLIEEIDFGKVVSGAMLEAPVIMHGYYYKQISLFFEYFHRDQIYFCTSSVLKKYTQRILDEITTFLGVERINWASHELPPIFEGGYQESAELRAQDLLAEIYREDSKKLVSLLNILDESDFAWVEAK